MEQLPQALYSERCCWGCCEGLRTGRVILFPPSFTPGVLPSVLLYHRGFMSRVRAGNRQQPAGSALGPWANPGHAGSPVCMSLELILMAFWQLHGQRPTSVQL